MIVNTPIKQYGEGNTHFKSKIRVANLADKYYENASIHYEYTFNPVEVESKKISYTADIAVFLSVKDWIYKVIDIELDGRKGHGTKIRNWRNNIRDEALANGVKLNLLYKGESHLVLIPCVVKRLTAYLNNVDDSDILSEFEQ